jgi:exopolysaccharide biosynthesis predicted pyruvyltransferase EpsI
MTTVGRLPDLSGLRSLLTPWRGRAGYLIEFVGPGSVPLGNNGDQLLGQVLVRVLRELGITLVRRPRDAEVLLVPPGGALLDRYQVPGLLARQLARLPDLPLIIFPQSSWFERDDPGEIFAGRRSPTLWISRERRSYDHLHGSWGASLARANVTLALDHDVALSGHAYVPEVLRAAAAPSERDDGLLLVARLGVEAGRMDRAVARPVVRGAGLRRIVAAGLRRLPVPALAYIRHRTTREQQLAANERMLAEVTERLGPERLPTTMSPWCFDISDPSLASFGQFAQAILGASAVVTNRLHVAVPAAILGKRTVFVEAGYHKASGVYERSLQECSAMTFLRRS